MSIEETDNLLRAKEAAKILGCSKQFLYEHAKKLPYTVYLTNGGGKTMVRFSSVGIQRFIARKLKIQEARSG